MRCASRRDKVSTSSAIVADVLEIAIMKALYNVAVQTPAGWRSVEVLAAVEKISEKRVKVLAIEKIDGETPNRNQSRTGAKRQQFNGVYFADNEASKTKNISSISIL